MRDKEKRLLTAEDHMYKFLEAVGADMTDANLAGTPARAAKMFMCELLAGEDKSGEEVPEIVSFDTPEIPQLPVITRGIPIRSLCAHHLMPISGYADVCAYYDSQGSNNISLPGLSKYARIVNYYSRRFQLQERIGNQIVQHLFDETKATVMIVRIAATHHCMLHRGVNTEQSSTITLHTRHVEKDMVINDRLYDKSIFKSPQDVLNYFLAEIRK